MLGFEETFVVEKKVDGFVGVVKQEVKVIDGSLFLAHWHVDEQYWSYDQFCRQLIEAFDFSKPKLELLECMWEHLHDVVACVNTLKFEGGYVGELDCHGLTVKVKS